MTENILVIGGGIAGIQASLDLADKGLNVYLVEKSPSIGGRMAQLDKTFPTNDCSIFRYLNTNYGRLHASFTILKHYKEMAKLM